MCGMKTTLYRREFYLKRVRPFYDSDIIKVITGIRRCGKSSLMLTIMDELRERGVDSRNVVYLNLDKRGFKGIKTIDALESAIDALVDGVKGMKYLFIDEVQNVEGFEEVLNAYREEGDYSVFITGSNSYLLSGELVTKLTGRYVEIDMFTLSFEEYVGMKRFLGKKVDENAVRELNEYLRFGGFPKALEFDDSAAKRMYLESVVEQIFSKDVKRRNKIRNRAAFDKVLRYFVNNFGTMLSIENVGNVLRNQEKIAVKDQTLRRYLRILQDAKILYACPRFDLKSRKSLQGEGKFYLADTGIYFMTNADGRINYGPVLENVVYTYFRCRGYVVSVGRIGNLECDFIARKDEEYLYAQVAMTIMAGDADASGRNLTEEREYRPFEKVRDNYPKYLFTLDSILQTRDGVHHENLAEFMLKSGK